MDRDEFQLGWEEWLESADEEEQFKEGLMLKNLNDYTEFLVDFADITLDEDELLN